MNRVCVTFQYRYTVYIDQARQFVFLPSFCLKLISSSLSILFMQYITCCKLNNHDSIVIYIHFLQRSDEKKHRMRESDKQKLIKQALDSAHLVNGFTSLLSYTHVHSKMYTLIQTYICVSV